MMAVEYAQVAHIIATLKKKKFVISNEKQLQADISLHLFACNISHAREASLSLARRDIPDFCFDEGVYAEVKIKGGKMAIYKQCERYCENEKVNSLILVTNRMMALPHHINNKPVYIINLSTAWL